MKELPPQALLKFDNVDELFVPIQKELYTRIPGAENAQYIPVDKIKNLRNRLVDLNHFLDPNKPINDREELDA